GAVTAPCGTDGGWTSERTECGDPHTTNVGADTSLGRGGSSSGRPGRQALPVGDRDGAAGDLDGAPELLLLKHAVHRRPGDTRELCEVLLGEGDHDGLLTLVVDLAQSEEPLEDPHLRRDVESLAQAIGK